MARKTLRVADIETSELLYYDKVHEESCYQFCEKRDIDYLPSVDDPSKFYQREDSVRGFVKTDMLSEHCVDGNLNIFHPDLLKAFERSPLLFVFTHKELTGIAHYSDYGRKPVSLYLYDLLFEYERDLRELLDAKGITNQQMCDFFQQTGQKRKTRDCRKNLAKMSRLPPFQSFYLIDLIGLLEHHEIMNLDIDVNKLRNQIMHAHELVDQIDYHADDYRYNFDSFKTFFNRVQSLLGDMKRVKSRIQFETGIE